MKNLNSIECQNISAAQGGEFSVDPENTMKPISELTEEDMTRLKALSFECDPYTAATTPWCHPVN